MGQGQCALHECQPVAVMRSISADELDSEDEDCTVRLNIYDLSEEWLLTNHIFQEVVELGGAFHAGVEIYGQEWSFGTEGVCCSFPRENDVHVYRQTIAIGETKYAPQEIDTILEDEMFAKWTGKSYDLLSRNCCSFSRSFCKRLTGDTIPDWVDRLPRLLNAVRKPVKGMADVAVGMGGSMPGSHIRQASIDSESDFSVYSFPTTLEPTPKYDNSEPSFGLRSSWTQESL
eukprot:gnl/MRDRNA2_/MRDRNA2_95443_c0_seq1.p1 gnl/MRDRNA2_/MRDRNA2_95443_c0~~gnl/MRDRNA2_/MRDRNA2_95443_c0_seq1.p1  ORF type:complete len:231 (+),score=35.72 gnl/MRDRNA2_/MRDRNA2_95443_c0_seq1:78-770(+)